jgi:glycosyltransferase involved in cell wall biosynthesis
MIVWNEFLHDARVTKEAETLTRAGYHVTVLALHLAGKAPRRETRPSGFSVVRVPFLSQGIWRNLSRLMTRPKLLRREKTHQVSELRDAKPVVQTGKSGLPRSILSFMALPAKFATHCALFLEAVRQDAHIYHAHDFNVLLTTWLASRFRRARIIYDAHEITTDREGYRVSRPVIRLIEGLLVHKVDAMITTNHMRAVFFQKEYGTKLPLVLQNRSKFQAPLHSNILRETLHLQAKVPIILYQGGVQNGRGMRNLVHVAERVEGAYFVFVGSGRQESVVKEMIEAKHLQDRVFMIPMVPLDKLPLYTASADVGVQILRNTCLNHYTTESNKLFEYLMAGLPVVASDFPEMRRIVKDFEVGLVVNPDDVDEIANALKGLIADRSLYEHFRKNALAAAKQLSWEEQEGTLVRLYQTL